MCRMYRDLRHIAQHFKARHQLFTATHFLQQDHDTCDTFFIGSFEKAYIQFFFNLILLNYFIFFLFLFWKFKRVRSWDLSDLELVRFASDCYGVVLSGSSWIQIGIFSTKTWSRNSLKKKSNLKIHFSYVQPRCLYIAMCALKSGERIVSTQNEKNSYTTYSKYNTIFCWNAWHNNSRHINTTHLNLVCIISRMYSQTEVEKNFDDWKRYIDPQQDE